jgi:hypothetical protein
MVSVIDVARRSLVTISHIEKRNQWLKSIGKTVTREDLLGKRGEHGYTILPLENVWNMYNPPFIPPITARDWYHVIEGIENERLKMDFLISITHGVMWHTTENDVRDTLNLMKTSDATLVFDSIMDMFMIISP